MKIGIIGAGITGLTIAYRLSQQKHQIDLWEAGASTGGLAQGFKASRWEWPLERHYHHIFTSDYAIRNLAKELNVPLTFYRPKTSIWYKNSSSRFDSPLSLFAFPYLDIPTKIRTAFWTAYLKTISSPHQFEKLTAKEWIVAHMGIKAWQTLWKPLFIGKFGQYADQISAVWFWSRIFKRSPGLGYFDYGFQAIIDALTKAGLDRGVSLHLNSPIIAVHREKNNQVEIATASQAYRYDRVIIAGSSRLFRKIVTDISPKYIQQINQLQSIGAVTLVLSLKQQFLTDHTYWLNINNAEVPFLAVVEHTNMINPTHYNDEHLIYVGNYLPLDHQNFSLSDQQLIKKFLPYLQNINSNFNLKWINRSWVFKASFAQPIVTCGYRQLLPDIKTPIPNLYWVSMEHVYPWDRGTNYSVEWGEKVSKMIK